MKNITISLEVARIMYNGSDSTLKKLAEDNFTIEELTEKELPKTWKELRYIEGYYPDFIHSCAIKDKHNKSCSDNNTTLFNTEEQAEAAIALAKLSQLMILYNYGWEPSYVNSNVVYNCICFDEKDNIALVKLSYRRFLTFKNEIIATDFLNNFRELIEIAKPLL